MDELRKADIQNRTGALRSAMTEAGACLVGFADLTCLDTNIAKGYSFGIGFALQYDLNAVDNLPQSDRMFREMSAELSKRSKEIYAVAGALIESWGYRYIRISSGIPADKLPDMREALPQKTIATLAGLGWIGKSSLLVSPEYGPRIRLGAMLTDGLFQIDNPVLKSKCEDCSSCVDVCPAGAIKGANWSQGLDRVNLLDARLCYEHNKDRICGLCLKACPVGR